MNSIEKKNLCAYFFLSPFKSTIETYTKISPAFCQSDKYLVQPAITFIQCFYAVNFCLVDMINAVVNFCCRLQTKYKCRTSFLLISFCTQRNSEMQIRRNKIC